MGYDHDSTELQYVTKRLERLNSDKVRNSIRISGIPDQRDDTHEIIRAEFVRVVRGVPMLYQQLDDGDGMEIRRI